MITVSTRDERQRPATRSCAHDTEEDDPPAVPAEGLGLALPMLIALESFALMTFANEGVNTSSLLRDLLRVDMVREEGMAWCTSNRNGLYMPGGRVVRLIEQWASHSQGPPARWWPEMYNLARATTNPRRWLSPILQIRV
jgi:hypothetical protein